MAQDRIVKRLVVVATTTATAVLLLSASGSSAGITSNPGGSVETPSLTPTYRHCMGTAGNVGEECSCALQGKHHPERLRDSY